LKNRKYDATYLVTSSITLIESNIAGGIIQGFTKITLWISWHSRYGRGACDLGFPSEPPLPGITWPWLKHGYPIDSEASGDYYALKLGYCLILVEFDDKSTFSEEQQAVRPGLKRISKAKSYLGGLKIGTSS
jgi:hypothetical protein